MHNSHLCANNCMLCAFVNVYVYNLVRQCLISYMMVKPMRLSYLCVRIYLNMYVVPIERDGMSKK